MAQPNAPSNNFVEFVQVWGGAFDTYLEAVILYDSRNGSKWIVLRHIPADFVTVFHKYYLKTIAEFTVQVGLMIGVNGNRVQIITTTGASIVIERKTQGNENTMPHCPFHVTINSRFLRK